MNDKIYAPKLWLHWFATEDFQRFFTKRRPMIMNEYITNYAAAPKARSLLIHYIPKWNALTMLTKRGKNFSIARQEVINAPRAATNRFRIIDCDYYHWKSAKRTRREARRWNVASRAWFESRLLKARICRLPLRLLPSSPNKSNIRSWEQARTPLAPVVTSRNHTLVARRGSNHVTTFSYCATAFRFKKQCDNCSASPRPGKRTRSYITLYDRGKNTRLLAVPLAARTFSSK